MPFIAIPKTLLSLVLLSVILWPPVHADDGVGVYRFGGWTLITPPGASPNTAAPGSRATPIPLDGIEFLAYWQDGKQRALALRFDATDVKKDVVALRSFGSVRRLDGCRFKMGARLPPLKKVRPKEAEMVEFPDDGGLQLDGGSRGLRRNGEVLVADLGTARVQITEDSPVVRVGEWDSAEFCRFELKPAEADEEE